MFVAAMRLGKLLFPLWIWEQFCNNLCNDLQHCMAQTLHGILDNFIDSHLDYGLYLINQCLYQYESSLSNHELPLYQLYWDDYIMNPLIAAEKWYDMEEEVCLLANQLPLLNLEQCAIYDTVCTSVNSDAKPTSFFL